MPWTTTIWIMGDERMQSCEQTARIIITAYFDQVSDQGCDEHRVAHHLFKVIICKDVLLLRVFVCRADEKQSDEVMTGKGM
jgi:hypothetical protein